GYQMVLLPERNTFTGNLSYRPDGGVAVTASVQDTAPPLAKFSFQPNTFRGNVVHGGTLDVNPPNRTEGIVVVPSRDRTPPAPPRTEQTGPSWQAGQD
ncbi:hypothetical protein, partial [Nonomuraea rhodomycinica]